MVICLTNTLIESLMTRCVTTAQCSARYLPHEKSQTPLIVGHKGPYREEVTLYDSKLEKIIIHNLLSPAGCDGYLAEESGACDGHSGIKWIIDPIDGTLNFARHIPAFTISIAAEVNGDIVAGAIYDPSHQETFTAGLGLGARCNGNTIKASETGTLSDAIISTGFSKKNAVRRQQADLLAKLLTQVRDIRSSGSAALELCWLAAGRVDAYYEQDLRYWDFAAGVLIAREAGADVQVNGDLVVGAAPELLQKLRTLMTTQ